MQDIRFEDIFEDDNILFIKNKRGEESRLVYGHVKVVNPISILVEDDCGELHRLRYSERSKKDGRLLGAVVVLPRTEATGDVLDFTGHPINPGDNVAFMEAPSQGFSTSFVIGSALRVSPAEIIILVVKHATQKYMRKPNETVVIKHFEDTFETEGNAGVLS